MQVAGNTVHTRPDNRAFYPALDGLRTVAFLMVFLHHYVSLPWGWAGVNFFFVLSGFLITGILWDTREDPHRARNFYVRRALRIFPLYYLVILVCAGLWVFGHWQWDSRWLAWLLYLGNFLKLSPAPVGSMAQHMADFQLVGVLHGHAHTLYLGHFWTLCIEEQFYLLWPWFVFRIQSRRNLLWICGLGMPVCLVLRLTATHVLPSWLLEQGVLSRFPLFNCDGLLLGGFCALLLRGPQKGRVIRLAKGALPPFLFACLALAFGRPSQWHLAPEYPYPKGMETYGFTVLNLLGAMLVLNLLTPGSWLYRLLDLRPLRWAGRISYGAYVLHDIPHDLYATLSRAAPSDRAAVTAVLGLVSTYALAALSFHFIESPFLNLKERWTVRPPHAAPPGVPLPAGATAP